MYHFFGQGKGNNFRMIYGENPFLWLIPVGKPNCDGITWKKNIINYPQNMTGAEYYNYQRVN